MNSGICHTTHTWPAQTRTRKKENQRVRYVYLHLCICACVKRAAGNVHRENVRLGLGWVHRVREKCSTWGVSMVRGEGGGTEAGKYGKYNASKKDVWYSVRVRWGLTGWFGYLGKSVRSSRRKVGKNRKAKEHKKKKQDKGKRMEIVQLWKSLFRKKTQLASWGGK